MEDLKQVAVIAAFSVGLIFSVITIGSAAFAQQENATSSSPPSTTGQITKGDIMKRRDKGGNITKGTLQNETVTGADIKGANITGAEIVGVDVSKVQNSSSQSFSKSKC